MNTDIVRDIAAIQAISAVPTILEAVAAITGLGFVCIAKVTDNSWTACAVRDNLQFGLGVGGQLDVATTLCEEVRDTRKAVIIDSVVDDPVYRDHHTPRIYGFQSYISIPIFRPSGEYFGTLCGLDPAPANLSNTATVSSMTLFAQLISMQLASEQALATTTEALLDERETAELREQFIAVLGHDVRNPLGAVTSGAELLMLMPDVGPKAKAIAGGIKRSAARITHLVDDVMDFTRGRMGGGISLNLRHDKTLGSLLQQVVGELSMTHPGRAIVADIRLDATFLCDSARLGQLLSNLLKNALVHGDPSQPVQVTANTDNGLFSLTVQNGGARVPQATIAQLFKPFWRGERNGGPDNVDNSQGLGLGLFIVAEIARSHGGEISVTSTEQATAFAFTMKAGGR